MIQVNKQFVPKEPFTVLVSGGIDSITAAFWLKHNFHKKFSILHFNHRVQPVNEDMEKSVKQFCDDFEIPYTCYYRHDDNFPDVSENGLREFRLSIMGMLGGRFLSVHHLWDAVENYLDNCLKGCPEHKPISWFTQFKGFSIYHPFLRTPKDAFQRYAYENDLMKYVVEDPTNLNTTNKRNWIRNILLPEIQIERGYGLETVVRKKFYGQ